MVLDSSFSYEGRCRVDRLPRPSQTFLENSEKSTSPGDCGGGREEEEPKDTELVRGRPRWQGGSSAAQTRFQSTHWASTSGTFQLSA